MFKINETIYNKIKRMSNLLFYINIPTLILIPFSLESGFVLSPVHSAKADTLYIALNVGEFFLFGNSIFMYTTLKKVVTCLTYVK